MTFPLHRFQALATISVSEEQILISLGEPEVARRKGATLQREGQRTTGFYMHVHGWIASSIMLPCGKRLIQKVHLPGDFLSTPSMALMRAADTLTAITDVVTSFVPYERLGELYRSAPRLAALFTIAAQMERVALMDTLAATGNATARARLAQLLLDLHRRQTPLGLVRDDTFTLPLTQEVMGDMLGLTNVHVNRLVRAFEREGLISRIGQEVRLLDLHALASLSPITARQPAHEPPWLPSLYSAAFDPS